MFTRGSDNYIKTLRIVGDVDDSLAFQLRLQSLLSSADFSIPGVSPASVVCIRSLPDPRPGTLRLARSELEGAGAWSEALTAALAGKVNRAVRPAEGFVPGDAECVLFADTAEMLACLARDWLGGLLWTRWWWKILLPSGQSSEMVKHLWRDHPEYVPAALDRLEREIRAASFLKALTDDECCQILQHTIRTFAIHELDALCHVSLPISSANRDEVSITTFSPAESGATGVERKFVSPPWAPWCREESASELSPAQQRLLGIALTIVRAPTYARTSQFARAVERWQEEVSDLIKDPDLDHFLSVQDLGESRNPSTARRVSKDSATNRVLALSAQLPDMAAVENVEHQSTPDPHSRQRTEPSLSELILNESHAAAEGRRPATALAAESVASLNQATLEIAGEVFSSSAETLVTARQSIHPATLGAVAETAEVQIETQLGGLFYLINLALNLDLYNDFTMTAAREIELNIWDFVTLLGAELAPDEDAADPIWDWLARMSRREDGRRAGEGFDPGDEWRLPPAWLSTFADQQSWQWTASRGRLRVAHPAGFIILDLPLACEVHEQLRKEIEPYGVSVTALARRQLQASASLRSKFVRGSALRRWLSLVLKYTRARLRTALAIDSDDEASRTLCRHYARVRATDTHVDIFFGLADLPLEIRFAGLDRDPGWVPAAGRFIAFHFD